MKYSFQEILEIRNGKNQRKVEAPDGPYPIYGSGGIMGRAKEAICEAPAVVIGRKGNINKPLYVEEPFWNIDTAFGLLCNQDLILTKYLYYFCLKFDFSALSTTVTIPSLTKANLLKVQIDLPSIATQQEIISKLDVVQALIAKRRHQLEKLDLLVKSQFVEMFGDPVEDVKKWPVNKLSDLGELNRGVSKHRPRNAPDLLGGPYPLIQTGDIANSNIYLSEYKSTYSEKGLAQSRMWPKGTLCITIAANIANTAILDFDSCFPDSVVGFISNGKVNSLFVHFWFSFFQKILEEQAPQVAQKNINLSILRNLDVICPPINLQHQFADFVSQVDKSKFAIQQSLDKLELLQRSLMNQYFG